MPEEGSCVKIFRAIGLMSGTSMDGIDVALIDTDGNSHIKPIASASIPYPAEFRLRLRKVIDGEIDPKAIEMELTDKHREAIEILLKKEGLSNSVIDIIGFHGHTVKHRPAEGITLQIGDGKSLAQKTGIKVAFDFRSADVKTGGEGAPLAPIYHAAIASRVALRPLAIVNIGGVANITWIDENGILVACDVGPGNGPIDDWVFENTGEPFDRDGRFARAGHTNKTCVNNALSSIFFKRPPPKSLDRLDFSWKLVTGDSLENGAATLSEITAQSVAKVIDILPRPPRHWIITGGGRNNSYLLERIRALVKTQVEPIESIGFNGDDIEAQAFAYLAVRTELKLPISFPQTTGVPTPMLGGQVVLPD